MQLKEMSLDQLKSAAYDQKVQIEMYSRSLSILETEIDARVQEINEQEHLDRMAAEAKAREEAENAPKGDATPAPTEPTEPASGEPSAQPNAEGADATDDGGEKIEVKTGDQGDSTTQNDQ